ncbi:general transcription repressor [Malassezia vespertilionis]|uniref:WD40 repeat-containing protein SMU1 n=1 Tax=Malassezia vespertilionis TaxID=2020962 RepID=A0A2N1JGH6_9BASI|nr:general transcription repressor [Malassezia vespertilionis]PKI85651.1 Tup1p [Malassezia vespertilionis]WFD04973.1 general transcription repressor [Malassezia vespertilionis]
MDLLSLVRHEFDVIGNDAVHFKTQRDEMEHRIAQQFNEVGMMQDHVYELEKRHYEIVMQYEGEIKRLRTLLDSRGINAEAPPASLPQPPAAGSIRNASNGRATSSPSRAASRPLPAEHARGAEVGTGPVSTPKRPKVNAPPSSATDGRNKFKREDREGRRNDSVQSARMEHDLTRANPSDAPPPAFDAPDEMQDGMQQLKKEGSDWVTLANPNTQHPLDVDLAHTLTHDSVVCCVRFSPDGKYLATGCNRAAHIYDVNTGEKLVELPSPEPEDKGLQGLRDLYIRSVCFSPDGKLLVTGGEDRRIRVWDIAEKTIKMQLVGHEQEIYSVEYSQDGKLLASGSGDKTVRIWDAETGDVNHVLYTSPGLICGPSVTAIAFSPNGHFVAAGSLDTFVRIWDAKTGKLRQRLKGHKNSIYSVAFMPDGDSLVSGSLDQTLKLWDISSIMKSNDSDDDEATTLSLCKNTFVGHKDFILSVSCAPQGNFIVSGSKDRCVQVWDPQTAKSQLVLQGHKNSAIATHINPMGTMLATGSGDFTARIWTYKSTQP